ncbi:SRPBCC family protein [Alteribacter natronophilus]|uniref:SRPBCC family protein n=1 Tax=Alteribacter natronophilus TaxID=2583810 RepID=UPI00110DE36A|nr:hypothetical protein [Alteribacter natronophilus]TMW73714.1 hypothetical protein FGB90_05320 [Alteribacter natronophilus]
MFRGKFVYTTVIESPVEDVWSFFSKNENLAAITGFPEVNVTGDREVRKGAVIQLELDFKLFFMNWQARIIRAETGSFFQDAGEKVPFPFRLWLHTHRFEGIPGGKTKMTDEVAFSSWVPVPLIKIMLYGMFLDRKRQLGRLSIYKRSREE